MIMDRVIETSEYGICIYSMEILQAYIKREKIRTKKLLKLFQKDKKKYLQLQEEGIWIPFVSIDLAGYCVRIKNLGEEFDDEWEEKYEYDGFNIAVNGGIWISDIGSFLTFDPSNYEGEGRECMTNYGTVDYYSNKEIWYTTLSGKKMYSDIWCDIPDGKYLLTIKGYVRKEIVDRKAVNYGFQFEFIKVEEFEGYKNPREEQYNFNIGSIK